MDTFWSRHFTVPGMGEDVFGAEFAGREIVYDDMNKDLFLKMLGNHVKWQAKNGRFHETFDKDVKELQRKWAMQYVYAGVGVGFAGAVWNPNFVNRRSFYMKKMTPIAWGLIGYNFGRRFYEDHITFTMLKMNDYLPLEVKRALQDKDFRHMGLFDPESRSLFDPVTGKSLS